MSSSRDFGFTTLRSIQAYQSNGARVPPNYILTTGENGAATFSNNITISAINNSTINTNSLNTSTINSSSIITNFLTVNSTFVSGNVISNTVSTNALNTNTLSTNTVITNYLSTFKNFALIDNNLSTLIVTWNNSTMFIDGHPISTDATISTVSTVFWNDGPSGSGSIYNKNQGNGNNRLVYIGDNGITGISPKFTLDVNGSVGASTFISTPQLIMSQGEIIGVSTINGQVYDPTQDTHWTGYTAGSNVNVFNANNGAIGIGTNSNIATGVNFQVNGNSLFNGQISTSNLRTPYLSSVDNSLVLGGEVYISSALGDGTAQLHLFNDKAKIATNSPYNGMYLKSGDYPIILCNDIAKYAEFGPNGSYIYTNLNVSSGATTISGPSFVFTPTVPTNIGVFKVELEGANLNVYRSTVNNASTTFLENNGGGQLVLATTNPIIFINSKDGNGDDNVGINTNTPQETLDVNGTIVITSSNTLNMRITSQFGDGYIESGNNLFFSNIGNVSTAMVIKPSQKRVGINTNTPQATLQVGDLSTLQFYGNTGPFQSTILIGPDVLMAASLREVLLQEAVQKLIHLLNQYHMAVMVF